MSELKSFEELDKEAFKEIRSKLMSNHGLAGDVGLLYANFMAKQLYEAILSLQKEVEELKRNQKK